MKTTQGMFSEAFIDRVAKEHGVDQQHLLSKDEIERQTIKKAQQAIARKRIKVFASMSVWPGGNIPLHFQFSSWQVDKQDNHELAKALGKQAYQLAIRMEKASLNVIMSGDKGTGKTSLALAIMDYLSDKGQSGMFVSTAELASLIGQQYELNDVKARLTDIERAMTEVDVLILDDFGTEGGMKQDIKPVRRDMQTMMYRIANSRVDFEMNAPRRSTIITTNNSVSELKAMYNDKLISRLVPKPASQQLAFLNMKDVRGI